MEIQIISIIIRFASEYKLSIEKMQRNIRLLGHLFNITLQLAVLLLMPLGDVASKVYRSNTSTSLQYLLVFFCFIHYSFIDLLKE